MPVTIERFLECLLNTGIMSAGEIATLSQSIAPENRSADADELARELVRGERLTRFQAAAIYQEKADGLLLGNYLVLDKLGAGGMGQVFRARHRRMDRVVAVKVLSKKVLDTTGALERFQREAQAAAKLTHPNIVTAYDADESAGMHFLVMEYVAGSDLASLVKRSGPLTVQRAIDCVRQAAHGLAYAHAKGIIHRDIKPANLLLDNDGIIKILDMGLARFSDPLRNPDAAPQAELTQTGSIMGTIDYMAPEQAMDCRQADARSDIYSLGCTLHYLLAGRPPFSGDTIMKRLTAHQQTAIPQLSTICPEASDALQAVFNRMLAKHPSARFRSMSDVEAALELDLRPMAPAPAPGPAPRPVLVATASVSAPSGIRDYESVVLPGRAARARTPKKPLIPIAIAVLAVALLAVVGLSVWRRGRAEPVQVTEAIAEPQKAAPANATPVVATSSPSAKDTAPMALSDAANEELRPMPQPAATQATPPAHVDAPPQSAATMAVPAAAVPAPPAAPPTPEPAAAAPPRVASEAASTADSKLPIPPTEAQEDAVKMLREIYKDDYARAKDVEGKTALGMKLWKESQASRDDATAQFVMLQQARQMAVEAADPSLAERAINSLARGYAIDAFSELAADFEAMVAKPHLPAANKAVAEAALASMQEAQSADDFELAKRLAEVTLAAARKAKDPPLLKRVVEQTKKAAAAKQQWDELQAALEKLKEAPDDKLANHTTGRYRCFVEGDWPQGLELLAKGSDGALHDAAEASLPIPQEPTRLAEVGDVWWNAAEKAKGKDKADLQSGATHWYTQADPGLSGLTKTVVAKRLAELKEKEGGVATASSKLPAANGIWISQTFDCATQAYPATLSPEFDIRKNWTLSLEFMPPNFDRGNHMIFFLGDGRSGRDPLFVSLGGSNLQAAIGDSGANTASRLETPLSPEWVGRWIRLVFHFDAPTNSLSLFLNNVPVKHERATVVPAIDRPMGVWIGGERQKAQRFSGQIRSVWLGNQGKPGAAGATGS